MKEIKFRSAHYNQDKTFAGFSYWGRLGMKDEHSNRSFKSPTTNSFSYSEIDEQFICLKDLFGTEIYEGDLLENNKGEIGLVVHWEAGFYLYCKRKRNEVIYIALSSGTVKNKRIIGNTHEKESQYSIPITNTHSEKE